jgi:hypothetical protein
MCNLQNFELTDFLVCAGIGAGAPKIAKRIKPDAGLAIKMTLILQSFWVIKWASSSKEIANGVVTKSSNLFLLY